MTLGLEDIEEMPNELHLHDIVDKEPVVEIRQKLVSFSRNLLVVEVDGREFLGLEAVELFDEFVGPVGGLREGQGQM